MLMCSFFFFRRRSGHTIFACGWISGVCSPDLERRGGALGRALVREPQVFLLGEPLSNLEPTLRGELRADLLELHRALHTTVVYVTHDQIEAMTMGQRKIGRAHV